MSDETKAVDDFLGDLKNDGSQDPLQDNPEDLFKSTVESQEGQKQEEVVEEVKEEKPLPFHKDPKVQRYIEREIAKRIPEEKPASEPQESNDIKEFATRLIGNDTPEKVQAVKDFERVLLEREDRAADKAYERLQSERQAEVQAEKEAEETLMSGFEAIEEEQGVDITSSSPRARKLRGEFVDFIRKVAPKDSDGEISEFPDFLGTFETFQSLKKEAPTANRAKELASRSSERGSSSAAEPIKERISFDSLDRIFEKFPGR